MSDLFWLIGRTKGGMNTKLHAICDSQGQPLNLFINAGQVKDWRRVATRYDRCPKVFLSAIALAAVVMFWL